MTCDLLIKLECGHTITLHEGPSYAIEFGRLPRIVVELEQTHRCDQAA